MPCLAPQLDREAPRSCGNCLEPFPVCILMGETRFGLKGRLSGPAAAAAAGVPAIENRAAPREACTKVGPSPLAPGRH